MHGSVYLKAIVLPLCGVVVSLVALDTAALGQYPTITGFGGGQLTSPEVGDVEGIQRFGESLRTNPDPGVGFTYRVLPAAGNQGGMDQQSMVWALAHMQEAYQLKAAYSTLAQLQEARRTTQKPNEAEKLDSQILATQGEIARLNLILQLALGNGRSNEPFSRYATGRNTTDGFRAPFSSTSRASIPGTTNSDLNGLSLNSANFVTNGIGVNGTLSTSASGNEINTIFHQPLIQIKVRIVEATRLNSAGFRSVLDYISQDGPASLVGANNINGNKQSARARTRLPATTGVLQESPTTGFLKDVNNGSGTLVNLTSAHINFITNILVTEFSGDVLTVPEVVTLNGQNVEFVAGDNRPLPLGLTLVQSTGNVKQDVFYKHVGTLLSITPRIVNWGKHLEGGGEAPLVAQEINNWNRLASWINDERNILLSQSDSALKAKLTGYSNTAIPIPIDDKTAMLAILENYPAKILRERFCQFDESILRDPSGHACDWKPEDCTIDLEIMVRESNIQADNKSEAENSIANVVQVKSGHGVVMGGMIAAREIETISKIPFLGDIPIVGYLFRSKAVDRAKTELIILVEATVLPNSEGVRDETARDFQLANGYVHSSLSNNPLEVGMYRAGFRQYLPQACPKEDEFWQKYGSKMRKVATEADDFLK